MRQDRVLGLGVLSLIWLTAFNPAGEHKYYDRKLRPCCSVTVALA